MPFVESVFLPTNVQRNLANQLCLRSKSYKGTGNAINQMYQESRYKKNATESNICEQKFVMLGKQGSLNIHTGAKR